MRFPGKNSVRDPDWSRRNHSWCAAGLLAVIASAGCWDEVHYDPAARTTQSTSKPPAVDSTEAAAESDTDGVGSDVEPTPADDGGLSPFESDVSSPDEPEGDESLDPQDVSPPIETAEPPIAIEMNPTPPATMPAPTSVDRQRAWTLASDWGLAAAGYAKGLDADRYELYLGTAGEAADALGIALPPLPTAEDPDEVQAAIAEGFRTGVGAELESAIAERVDAAAGAAARLALNAHLLLLTYTPDGSTVWGDAVDLRDAGAASQLPPELWRPLVELLERRAEFVDVRTAVFALRDGVAAHLAVQTGR